MTIIRNKERESYTIIDNSICRNKKLSYGAKGLLVTLLSNKDTWNLKTQLWLKTEIDKEQKIRKYINELIENGYIRRVRVRTDKGRYSTYKYTIIENPKVEKPNIKKPNMEKPNMEKPNVEKQGTNINTNIYKNINNKFTGY